MLSRQYILVAVMVFFGLIMISPLFPHFGIRGTYLTVAMFAALLVVFGGTEIRLSNWFPIATLIILVLACVPAIYWTDARYVLSPIFLIFPLFLLQWIDSRTMQCFITIATGLMLVLLIGAVIGFVLALNGVQPIAEIANVDGKSNYFFYTTFSRLRWAYVIRPTGFYDEPGTFSFMICTVAALRHLHGRDARVTWLLLGMGFVTLSLAHPIYVILHAMAERLRFRNVIGIVATLLPMILVAGYLGGFDILQKRVFARATIADSGQLVGDNRSQLMANAAEHLSAHPRSIFFGADPSCRFEKEICKEKFPLMGENPLSPLTINGIFVSWPYYLALVVLFIAPLFGRQFMVSFAFGALLLQRPYMTGMGYALMGLLVLNSTVGGIVANRYGERFRAVTEKNGSPPVIAGYP